MKEILNPFAGFEGYNCFGCSQDNDIGLRMKFYEDGDDLVSNWHPHVLFQGWNSILHGGIQCTLLDEIASWFVFVKLQTFGVTSNIDIKLKKPVNIDKGDIHLRAGLAEMRRNIAFVKVNLHDGENTLCAEGMIQVYTFPPDKPVGNIGYPGIEKFKKE